MHRCIWVFYYFIMGLNYMTDSFIVGLFLRISICCIGGLYPQICVEIALECFFIL